MKIPAAHGELDLHEENIMKRGTQMVIVDPLPPKERR